MKQNSKKDYPASREDYLLLRELYINLGSRYVRNRVDFPAAFLDVGGKLLSPTVTAGTIDTLLDLLAQAEKELETKIKDRNANSPDDEFKYSAYCQGEQRDVAIGDIPDIVLVPTAA